MDMGYVLLFLLVALIALMILWGVYGISPLTILRLVFPDSVNNNPVVMSRARNDSPENMPLSLRQTEPETDRQPASAAPSRDIMLDTYKRLRKYGMPREEARGMLKAMNLPLDNNLWAQAAPPPEAPKTVTPIAGRSTEAQFHDPELAYQPPPR